MDTPSDFGQEAFDPQAPLIGGDGLEYACFADVLAGHPFDSFRNDQIARLREEGFSEKDISIWCCGYDGVIAPFGPIELCIERGAGERAQRCVRANFALDPAHGAPRGKRYYAAAAKLPAARRSPA